MAKRIQRGISDEECERCVVRARTMLGYMLGSHAAVADADESRLHAIAVRHADHPAGRMALAALESVVASRARR